jgi:hypothetical protein
MSVVEHRQAGRLNASFVIFPPISLLIVASLFSARLKSLTPAPIFGLARCNKPIMEANLYHAQAGLYGLFDLRSHVLNLLKYAFLHRFAAGSGCPSSFQEGNLVTCLDGRDRAGASCEYVRQTGLHL